MPNLTSLISHLERERNTLASQLEALNRALSALGSNMSSHRGRIFTSGRGRIAAAQRARWAKAKGQKVVPIAKRTGRRFSAAARRRIAAAQRARWAKWRRAQKAA